jgi:hypothetical protein
VSDQVDEAIKILRAEAKMKWAEGMKYLPAAMTIVANEVERLRSLLARTKNPEDADAKVL